MSTLPKYHRGLEIIFPHLTQDHYKITSPEDINYNCIAWAAGSSILKWWPDPFGYGYWPDNVAREEKLEVFIEAYKTIGYMVCENEDFEEGYEKIAIYTNNINLPTHAARQINSTTWASKIGDSFDIEHELSALDGKQYGRPIVFMKRPLKSTTTN